MDKHEDAHMENHRITKRSKEYKEDLHKDNGHVFKKSKQLKHHLANREICWEMDP